MSTFFERYSELCVKKDVSLSRAAIDVGLSNAAASGWAEGKVPRLTTLKKLADYFGVSVEYLKGEEEQKEKSTNTKDGGLSKIDLEIASKLDQMSQDQKERFLDFLISMLDAKKL